MSADQATPGIGAAGEPGPAERARDFGVAGRVVIITGAGQGIGREYARQFAAAGAICVIADRAAEAGERVVAEIRDAGGDALAIATDVGDPSSVQALAERVQEEHGRIDVLVNNAAIFSTLTLRRFDEIPVDEWEQVMRVNVTGCFLAARAVLPAMIAARWGRIINIVSATVPLGVPNYLHYVTSKAALIGMTNAMSQELGEHGINVNAVQPGVTFTEVERASATEASKAGIVARQAIKRAETPSDLAGLVVFLATEAAGFITGQTIACDGGLTHR